MTDFTVVIPARYASTRFPGKPLALIHNKAMLQHVYERSLEAGAKQTIIAIDDARIEQAAKAFGADVCMTSSEHESGTTRIAEVIKQRNIGQDEIVINVQGDEPFIPAENIRQLADNLATHRDFPMATLCYPISEEADIVNPNVVKVVKAKSGKALYFSRSPIPFMRNNERLAQAISAQSYLRHIGIYGYRAGFVTRFAQMGGAMLEQSESLEQLRVLEQGENIHIENAKHAPPHGVDTPEDLARLNEGKV